MGGKGIAIVCKASFPQLVICFSCGSRKVGGNPGVLSSIPHRERCGSQPILSAQHAIYLTRTPIQRQPLFYPMLPLFFRMRGNWLASSACLMCQLLPSGRVGDRKVRMLFHGKQQLLASPPPAPSLSPCPPPPICMSLVTRRK